MDMWQNYQNLVLTKLEEHGEKLCTLENLLVDNKLDLERIRGDVSNVRLRASFFGLVAGALPSLVVALLILLKG